MYVKRSYIYTFKLQCIRVVGSTRGAAGTSPIPRQSEHQQQPGTRSHVFVLLFYLDVNEIRPHKNKFVG